MAPKSFPRYNLPMEHSFDEVRQFASELPEEQRLILANTLLESLTEEAADAELAAAWDKEIALRVAELKAGAAATCSFEELATDLRAIARR